MWDRTDIVLDEKNSTHYAYLNNLDYVNGKWLLVDAVQARSIEKNENVKLHRVLRPSAVGGQEIYIPDGFLFRTEKVEKVEPVFIGESFSCFFYHILETDEILKHHEFYTSKLQAAKAAWSNKLTVILYRILNKI